MKLNLIFFAGAIAEQTTTWETTTTEFTTRVDDWCGRHHDTLESFTQQVSNFYWQRILYQSAVFDIFLNLNLRSPTGLILLWVSRPKSTENLMKSDKNVWKTRFWTFGIVWPEDWNGSSMEVIKNAFTKKFLTCPVINSTKMCLVTIVHWTWQIMD